MEKITCPNCKHEFEFTVEDIYKEDYKRTIEEFKKKNEEKLQKILEDQKNERREFEEMILKRSEIQKKEDRERFERIRKEDEDRRQREKKEEEARTKKREDDLKNYFEKLMEGMKKDNEEKDKRIKELLDLMNKEREESRKRIEEEKENIKKEIESKKDLEIQDLKLQNEKYEKDINNLKTAEGSQQRKGEVLELMVEEKLKELYPMDKIMEVKKGAKGADVVQHVNNRDGEVGILLYEIKNTANFKKEWLQKLNEDQMRENADIAILITKTMPSDSNEEFLIKDNVVILKMDLTLLKIVSQLLREKILEIGKIKKNNENSAEKSAKLYTFVQSNEFRMHIGGIIMQFNFMRENLLKQKNLMDKYFKTQEKSIDSILEGISNARGSIEAVALTDFLEPPKGEIF